jgi:NAD(P)-dependent dehydrogenase (short-subunit alcohol dehydrogenase family)
VFANDDDSPHHRRDQRNRPRDSRKTRAVRRSCYGRGPHAERGEKTIAEIRAAGGKADFISSDLRDAESARALARKAVELGSGHVDMLINNAGVFPFGPTHEMSERSFDDVYALNVKAPYFLVAELAPLMAQRGKGTIVNVSTLAADFGMMGLSLYGSSKAATNLLTKAWAAEYAPRASA